MNGRRLHLLAAAALGAAGLAAAVPQLKGAAEPAGATGLRVKALAGSRAVQAATPPGRRWTFRRGDEKWTETHYDVLEIWRGHERGAAWKDRKGNALTLATPTAFCPDLGDHATRAAVEAAMAADAEAFADPSDETLAKWAGQFSGKPVAADALAPLEVPSLAAARLVAWADGSRCAAFFRAKTGPWRYAEFRFAEAPRPKDAARLVRQFLAAVQVDKARADGACAPVVEGRWITMSVPGYVFKTDLSKSQGQAFVKNAGRMMEAMQAAYRRYVPPQKALGTSTIRVFATREGYNEYLVGTTSLEADRSIGLWNPSREELLILDRGNSARAETLKTMRHEAFHQYLFYATGGARHATWFNEGHACFFENVSFDARKNAVRVNDDPRDRRPAAVEANPEKFAKLVPEIIRLDYEAFYSGTLAEVNDRYTAAWALVYFLEKGAPTFKELAAWRGVLPAYLKATAEGLDWKEATERAWECAEGRDFTADFLRFWGRRGAARAYEPAPAAPASLARLPASPDGPA